jgi:hypothetical protein
LHQPIASIGAVIAARSRPWQAQVRSAAAFVAAMQNATSSGGPDGALDMPLERPTTPQAAAIAIPVSHPPAFVVGDRAMTALMHAWPLSLLTLIIDQLNP